MHSIRTITCIFLWACLWLKPVFSQNALDPVADSLLDLYFEAENTDRNRALSLAEQAARSAEQHGDQYLNAVAVECIGVQKYFRGEYSQALFSLNNARELYQKLNSPRGIASVYNNMGLVEQDKGNYSRAVACYTAALIFDQDVKDTTAQSYTLNNLGTVYLYQGDYRTAREYFGRSLALTRSTKDAVGEGDALNNLGLLFQELHHYDSAHLCFRRALQTGRNNKNKVAEAIALINLGLLKLQTQEYDSSDFFLSAAQMLSSDIIDHEIAIESMLARARWFQQQGMPSQAAELLQQAQKMNNESENLKRSATLFTLIGKNLLLMGNPQKALEYYRLSLSLSQRAGIAPEIAENCKEMAIAFSAMGLYDSAGERIIRYSRIMGDMLKKDELTGESSEITAFKEGLSPFQSKSAGKEVSVWKLIVTVLGLLALMWAGLVFIPRWLKPFLNRKIGEKIERYPEDRNEMT